MHSLAGKGEGIQLELSPAPTSESASESTAVGSQASGAAAPSQSSSTSGDETSPKLGGSGKPFVEPVLQPAEEYYKAQGLLPQGQPGTEDKANPQEEASVGEGSPAAAFAEPQLQSAEEYFRQQGLISGEAPSAQGEAADVEVKAAAGEGEQAPGTTEDLYTEDEPAWNLAASGKLPAQPADDGAGVLEDAMLSDALAEEQLAERDPAEPLEIVLHEDAGELPAGWYNDRPRSAGGPEEPFWNAAGKARVIVKRQRGKSGSGGVTEARHLLRARQR